MRNDRFLLLRTLLRESSQINQIRMEKDKKKRGRAIGGLVGVLVLYAMLAVFATFTSVGLCFAGAGENAVLLVGIIISALGFIGGLLRSNGYLFAARDYNSLMSLPFSEKSIVTAKILSMYLRNIPFSLVISYSVMVGYILILHPGFLTILFWILLTFVVPLIPMVIGAIISAIAAGASTGFKHKSIAQSILIFVISLSFIVLTQILSRSMDPETLQKTMETMKNLTGTVGKYLPTVALFKEATADGKIVSALILAAVSVLVFEVAFFVISRFYRRINTKLLHRHTEGHYQLTKQKATPVVRAIAFKEWRHFVGSAPYLTNIGMGHILGLLLSVLILVLGPNAIVGFFAHGIGDVDMRYIIPLLPLVLYFCVCMLSTTTVSWSLEGKNMWILESLPIKEWDIMKGKMLFNLLLDVPFFLLETLLCAIACRASIPEILMYIVLSFGFSLFSTFFGMLIGRRFVNTSWENEVEVLKRGAAVTIDIFSHLGIFFGMLALSIFLSIRFGSIPTMAVNAVVFWGLAMLFFVIVKKGSKGK